MNLYPHQFKKWSAENFQCHHLLAYKLVNYHKLEGAWHFQRAVMMSKSYKKSISIRHSTRIRNLSQRAFFLASNFLAFTRDGWRICRKNKLQNDANPFNLIKSGIISKTFSLHAVCFLFSVFFQFFSSKGNFFDICRHFKKRRASAPLFNLQLKA